MLRVIQGQLVVFSLSSSSSVEGVAIAIAVTATVHGVGLAPEGHLPLSGVGDRKVHELMCDIITLADHLSNALGAAQILGHAVNKVIKLKLSDIGKLCPDQRIPGKIMCNEIVSDLPGEVHRDGVLSIRLAR